MDGTKEWFTLREVAELWRPADASGVPLTGTTAIDAVLKLIYVSVTGVRLQASYNLAAPIQAERFVWGKDGGSWEYCELRGMVNIRFRHDHVSTDDGLIWIHVNDDCDGVPNELLVLPNNSKIKVRIPLQHSIVAEDEHFSDSAVKLDEAGLLVSRDALADYAGKRGWDDLLKRLDGQAVVQPVLPAEEVEQGAEVNADSRHTDLRLLDRNGWIAKCTEQAQGLLHQGKTRREAAESLKRDGATHEVIGMILTNDGNDRERSSWEQRSKRLLAGRLKGFV